MEELLYVKYSDERSEQFSLYTEIWQNQDKRYIRKYPEAAAGMGHVEHICAVYEDLSKQYENTAIDINCCEKIAGGIGLEYIEGNTLEQSLDSYLEQDGEMAVVKVFSDLFQEISVSNRKPFEETAEFVEVFGHADIPGEQETMEVTDIDMVPANFILGENKKTLIDYEWTYDFPIPIKYVMYRTLHYYIETSLLRQDKIHLDLYQQFGITEEEKTAFAKLEHNFQQYIQGKRVPIREMYAGISPGTLNVLQMVGEVEQHRRESVLQVFYSTGTGFVQEKS